MDNSFYGIYQYISETPPGINLLLNKQNINVCYKELEYFKGMIEYFNEITPSSEETILYRGVNNNDLVSKTSFISTTSDLEVALSFSDEDNPIVFEITVSRDNRILDVSLFFLDYENNVMLCENEYILLPGSLTITGLKNQDDIQFICVEYKNTSTPEDLLEIISQHMLKKG